MSDLFIFSTTKGKKEDTLLFQSSKYRDEIFFKEHNKSSLQKIYNKAIDFAIKENVQYIVLVHDDIILENFSHEKMLENFEKYDVLGVAGTTEVKLQQPALWHLMGGGFNGNKLHGAVAHLHGNKKAMTSFGPYPHRAVLLDGVFLAIKREVFKKVRFDEDCPSKWHFYDIDYTLASHKAGFKNGVSDIYVTHASPGLTEFTDEFKQGEKWFLNKWKT
jgi:GT2 family glycosyltransferase